MNGMLNLGPVAPYSLVPLIHLIITHPRILYMTPDNTSSSLLIPKAQSYMCSQGLQGDDTLYHSVPGGAFPVFINLMKLKELFPSTPLASFI